MSPSGLRPTLIAYEQSKASGMKRNILYQFYAKFGVSKNSDVQVSSNPQEGE